MVPVDLGPLLSDHASRHGVPGAVLAVMVDGEVATASTGVADLSTGEPVTPETRFAIGSITKPMVATALIDLARSGSLAMDDSVASLLPSLGGSPWARTATLQDLLTNRSRIPQTVHTEFSLEGDDSEVLQRNAGILSEAGPAAPHWSYSNFAWCILGAVMEQVTSRSWEEAMSRSLLQPMEMSNTSFPSQPQSQARAIGYEMTAQGPSPLEPWTTRAYCSAGTGLLASVGDLLRFAERHLTDPALAGLQEIHVDFALYSWFDAWGLGWGRFDWPPTTAWGWDGIVPGQRASLRIIPDLHAALVLLTNADSGKSMYRSLFEELLAEVFSVHMPGLQLEPRPGSAGELDRFAGTYAWPDREYRVAVEGDALAIRWDDEEAEAWPLNDRAFVINPESHDAPTIAFGEFDPDGRPHVLYRMLWGSPRV
jgi:CubicO group peptidase (beta-lactamase class C family)